MYPDVPYSFTLALALKLIIQSPNYFSNLYCLWVTYVFLPVLDFFKGCRVLGSETIIHLCSYSMEAAMGYIKMNGHGCISAKLDLQMYDLTQESNFWPCTLISSLLMVNNIVAYRTSKVMCFILVVHYFDLPPFCALMKCLSNIREGKGKGVNPNINTLWSAMLY